MNDTTYMESSLSSTKSCAATAAEDICHGVPSLGTKFWLSAEPKLSALLIRNSVYRIAYITLTQMDEGSTICTECANRGAPSERSILVY